MRTSPRIPANKTATRLICANVIVSCGNASHMEAKALFKLFAGGYFGWIQDMPEVYARGVTLDEARENLQNDIRRVARWNREDAALGRPSLQQGLSYDLMAIMSEEFTEKALENAGEVIRETLSIPDL